MQKMLVEGAEGSSACTSALLSWGEGACLWLLEGTGVSQQDPEETSEYPPLQSRLSSQYFEPTQKRWGIRYNP